MSIGMAGATGIGEIGSLLGGIFGSNAATTAGGILGNAGNVASNNIWNATNTAMNNLSGTTASGQNTLASATGAGQTGIASGTAAAQNQMAGFLQNLSPYQAAGKQGVSNLANMGQFSFNPSNLQNDPGYQFQLAQGLQAERNQMTAAGLGNSGAAMKGAGSYATGLAGTYFNNAYQRALGTFQTNQQAGLNLANLGMNANQMGMAGNEYIGTAGMQGQQAIANLGMQGASGIANMGIQGGSQIANMGLGGTEAAMNAYLGGQAGLAGGVMGSGNAWTNAFANMGNSLQQGVAMQGMQNSNMNPWTSMAGMASLNGMASPENYMGSAMNMGLMDPNAMPNLSAPEIQPNIPSDFGGFANLGVGGSGG